MQGVESSSIPPPGKPIIGLIGGIGSGKSRVSAALTSLGGLLINADELGHQALRQPEILRQVVQRLGHWPARCSRARSCAVAWE